jgi:NADH-quinone oxidoreductase subunit L
MNRIGDVGMVLAMALLFQQFGTLEYAAIAEQAGSLLTGNHLVVLATLLLFIGAMGKSAQLPLLHLVARRHGGSHARQRAHPRRHHGHGGRVLGGPQSNALYALAPCHAQDVIAGRGDSPPRCWAGAHRRSPRTGHQEGVGLFHREPTGFHVRLHLGMGAWSTGPSSTWFTHAFFKALLFLGAGSVIHALGR